MDGAENNANVFISQKFYEAGCMNFTNTRHFANQHTLIVNKKWFDKVGEEHPDLQKLIREAPHAIEAEYNAIWSAGVAAAMADMNRYGITVNDIDDVQPFIEKVQPVYDAFFESHPEVPRSLVDRVRREAGL